MTSPTQKQPEQPDERRRYKPGDMLDEDRIVLEVDADGYPTVVKRKRRPMAPPSPPTLAQQISKAGETEVAKAVRLSEEIAARTDAGDHRAGEPPTKKKKAPKKQPLDQVAVKEKLAAAAAVPAPTTAQTAGRPTEETEKKEPEMATNAKKAKKTKKAKVAKAPSKRMTWTSEVKAKYAALIKNGKATYATIAAELKITPQTVWAQLNRKPKASKKKR